MEQSEKVNEGLLKFSNQESIQEVGEFLQKLKEEGAGKRDLKQAGSKEVPLEDAESYNLKSLVYITNNELDKAYRVLTEGLKKHPENFDLLYNAAYLKELSGQPLRAMDMYKNAYGLSDERENKKEILLALERIQKSLKEDVQQLISQESQDRRLPFMEDRIPSAGEATEGGTVVEVDIHKCRDPYAFGFEPEGWHPFVETLKETEKNPKREYQRTALKRFYHLFSPGSLPEAVGLENTEDFPGKEAWSLYPWGYIKHQGKLHAVENKEHPRFHDLTDNVGPGQLQTLIDHYQLLRDTGYHWGAFDQGYVKGVVLKKGDDYRFVVYEGVELIAALTVLGYQKIRCRIMNTEGALGVVDMEKIKEWPLVQNNRYTDEQAKAVFNGFFNHNGRERALRVYLLHQEMEPERKKLFEKIGIDMTRNTNVNFYNAGWLDTIDQDYVQEVQQYWETHYGKKIDPGLHLAYKNVTGKKEVRLIPHEILKNEFLPLFNDQGMALVGYNDKNLYDKLVSTSRKPNTILRRVSGKYFDQQDQCLKREEAFERIKKAERDVIIKPSTANDGIGVAKLSVRRGEVRRGDKIVTLSEIEQAWERDFLVQDVIRQHPVMAKPHPDSVNALRMITFRWKNEIKNLMTVAFFGGGGRIQNNVDSLGCGVSDDGEFYDRIFDKKGKSYTHHPTTHYSFKEKARIPNYPLFKKFVRDLHKEIYHLDYICWDIIVGEDGEPIFLEFNFWGTTWFYQLVNETPFFGEDTEQVLGLMARKNGLL